jgi:hypothetical protein
MSTVNAKVTLYKVHIFKGYAPSGAWVTFTDPKEAKRYYDRCTEGSARLVKVEPVIR